MKIRHQYKEAETGEDTVTAASLREGAELGVSASSREAEMGADAVLAKTAVAAAGDPAKMAETFNLAIRAANMALEAKPHVGANAGIKKRFRRFARRFNLVVVAGILVLAVLLGALNNMRVAEECRVKWFDAIGDQSGMATMDEVVP